MDWENELGTPAVNTSELGGADAADGVDALSLKSQTEAETDMPLTDLSNGGAGLADQPMEPPVEDSLSGLNGIAGPEQTKTGLLPVSTQEISAAGVSEAEKATGGMTAEAAAEKGATALDEAAGTPARVSSGGQLVEPVAVEAEEKVGDPGVQVLEEPPAESPKAAAAARDTLGASADNGISTISTNYVKTEEYQPDSPLPDKTTTSDDVPTDQLAGEPTADLALAPDVVSAATKVEEVLAPPMSVSAMAKQMGASSSSTSSAAVFKPSPRPLTPKEKTPIDPSSVVRATDKMVEVMEPSMSVAEVAKQLASGAPTNTGNGGSTLQRENSGSKALSAALSEHDAKNTANVAILLQSADFKKQPGKDFVEYQELIKLRLEDGIDVTRKEEYLDDSDFQKVFKMDKAAFVALPAWKKLDLKKRANLF